MRAYSHKMWNSTAHSGKWVCGWNKHRVAKGLKTTRQNGTERNKPFHSPPEQLKVGLHVFKERSVGENGSKSMQTCQVSTADREAEERERERNRCFYMNAK